ARGSRIRRSGAGWAASLRCPGLFRCRSTAERFRGAEFARSDVPGDARGVVLPWEQLRLVLALARHGTFAGAGRALGMSPAALEAELKRVERSAGAALFVRAEKHLLATDARRRAIHTG